MIWKWPYFVMKYELNQNKGMQPMTDIVVTVLL